MKASDKATAEGILFTDQYQLTMAQLYYRMGLHERQAQFNHFFRDYPDYGGHQAGYCINAGLEWLVDWMQSVRFRDQDIEYLRSQTGRTGSRVFDDDFLDWLRKNGSFDSLTVRAVPEGRVVHPNVPLTVTEGPLPIAQILESPLLNQLNYQILIATKAARMRDSGCGGLLLEFGMRRAQGTGANPGARAALIGGADFSSNVGVSHVLGYAPKGTHAHSMVQTFMALGEGELGAFRAYADVYPDDCLLLVDTVNTLESGVPNAIKVFEQLRRKGHRPVGIRLDSGDLAYLSIQAWKMLSEAGFPDVSIVLSNQLDEFVMWQIICQIRQEAPHYGVDPDNLIARLVYGVGTRLITSEGDAALDGVYKLVAVMGDTDWIPAIKVSESPAKVPNPGDKQVWRVYEERDGGERAALDLLSLGDEDPDSARKISMQDAVETGKSRTVARDDVTQVEPLLVDVLKQGKRVYDFPSIEAIRARRQADIDRLSPGVKRFINPHAYRVYVTQALWDLKTQLIRSATQG